jgi:RND family efflux transporter MFP subunit
LKKKLFLPLVVVAGGLALAILLVANPNEVADVQPERVPPLLTVGYPDPVDGPFIIQSQGTVEAAHAITLSPEVSGRVASVGANFQRGGSFHKGDILLQLDDTDARLQIKRARAQAKQALAEDQIAINDLNRAKQLFAQKLISSQALEQAELSSTRAQAQREAAEAFLEESKLALERTILLAPFDGRIEQEFVDVGQFVSRGERLAELIALSFYEVRLPIARDQLSYLKLPFSSRGIIPEAEQPKVFITGEFAGYEWLREAKLVRTEAVIDQSTRQVFGVAQLTINTEDPDTLLPLGLFVKAEIEGITPNNAYRLPRSSLSSGSRILVVDNDNRLWLRETEILRLEHDHVVVRGNIDASTQVAVRGVNAVVDGMHVNPVTGN